MRKKVKQFSDLPFAIRGFSNLILDYINSGKTCKNCSLFGRGAVILDTNLQNPGPVHLSILGLNPGNEELSSGIPFVGGAGRMLRYYLKPLIDKFNLSYVIYSTILCHTPNEKSISDFKKVGKCCSSIVDTITQYFPSTIKVVLGEKARTIVGATGGQITKVNGQLIKNYFVMIHPSSLQYNNANRRLFEEAMQQLEILILRTFDFSEVL